MSEFKRWLAFAGFVMLAVSSAWAEDANKPAPCQPQPTCEFSNLIIKPGAPTPGVQPQDEAAPGVNLQGKMAPGLRDSYRLPSTSMAIGASVDR